MHYISWLAFTLSVLTYRIQVKKSVWAPFTPDFNMWAVSEYIIWVRTSDPLAFAFSNHVFVILFIYYIARNDLLGTASTCIFWRDHCLSGQFTPKSKTPIFFLLTCSAMYSSRLFWCELLSCVDISYRGVCLLSNIVELDFITLYTLFKHNTCLQTNQDSERSRSHRLIWWTSPLLKTNTICRKN